MMMWLLRLIFTIYFIPAKIICGITIILLIADVILGRRDDTIPFAKSGGVSGVILVLVTSYLAWPYYLWIMFHRRPLK